MYFHDRAGYPLKLSYIVVDLLIIYLLSLNTDKILTNEGIFNEPGIKPDIVRQWIKTVTNTPVSQTGQPI